MENFFLLATGIAMITAVFVGALSVVAALFAIPYHALVKRDKPFNWYLKQLAIPLCSFCFAGLMFVARAFAPNFFGKPGGITITNEYTRTVDGKIVHSDKEQRNISVEQTSPN